MAFLSKLLSRGEYIVLPATTIQTATSLLEKFEIAKIDVLVVNPAVSNIADLVTVLKGKNHSLRVIAIEGPGVSAITKIPVDASLRKPFPNEVRAEEDWFAEVKQVLG